MPAKKPKRKPGGQPGNQNALKHGFYSRNFKPDEREDLEASLAEGISSEIKMMRIVIRRAFSLATEFEGGESEPGEYLERTIQTMNALGMAAIRLGSLLKLEKALGRDSSGLAEKLNTALNNVIKEMKL
jgi:hypothetical protein